MTLLQVGLAAVAALLAGGWGLTAYYKWQTKRTQEEIAEVKQEIEQTKQQSAVLKTQRNNQRKRQKNEENTHSSTRDELIDSLSKQGDLRD